MQDAGSDGTRAKRKQFGVFCACRWQRCCCLYGTETSACPRFMGTIGQDTAHPLMCTCGALEIKCKGIAKLVANQKCLFRFHVSKADVFVAIDGSMSVENVRFGSLADIRTAKSHVRFTPESGHLQCTRPCPLWANSGQTRARSKRPLSANSGHRSDVRSNWRWKPPFAAGQS